MSDTKWDFIQDKIEEERRNYFLYKRDYCERDCECHNVDCPYYDAEEESWDFDQCIKDNE